MTLSLLEVVAILTNLVLLSVSSGLVFASVLQPNRNISSYVFATFCITLIAWGFLALVRNLSQVDMAVSHLTLLRLQVSAMAFTVIAYFFFILLFIEPSGPVANALTVLSPVLLIGSLSLIWLTDAVVVDVAGDPELSTNSYVLIVLALVYLLVSFWSVLSSDNEYSNRLIVPSIGLVVAYAVNGFEFFINLPVDGVILTLSVIWIGVVLLRAQVFNPVNRLNQELRTTNRDLQRVVTDLASEKEKTEALNRELVAANRYKSEFLANISHELRTPLNSIIGYSELLSSKMYGDLNDTQYDRVEKIYRNGMGLLELISDILDLNKIDAGKLKLEMTPFAPKTIIEKSRDEYQAQIEEKGLTLDLQVTDNLPRLYGDTQRIQQVMNNLLDNAIKFTHEGTITVRAQEIDVDNGVSQMFVLPAVGWLKNGKWVVISVSDTGIGISPEEQGRIFDEFSQVDGSHTREYGGTGLGLAICKRLVEMHSGVVWVESNVDKGSTFHVALPGDLDLMKRVATSSDEVAN